MHPESDGIDEALQGAMQIVMTAAARSGEKLAREYERQARESHATSQQAARELDARLTAERESARASLAPVNHSQWWNTASGEDVAKVLTTARAWSDLDPEAKQAEERIVYEVRDRYGIDVSEASDQAAAADAIEQAERARAEASEQRNIASLDRAEAVSLVSQADAIDRAAENELFTVLSQDSYEFVSTMRERHGIDVLDPKMDDKTMREVVGDAARADFEREHTLTVEMREDASMVYDSAERREALAASLDGIEDKAAIAARLRSDVAQAYPATEAVTKAPGRAPKANKSSRNMQGRQTQKTPRGR